MDVLTLIVAALIGTLVSGALGGFIWLVQLKPEIVALKNEVGRLDTENEKIAGEISRHKENSEIHFNQRLAAEVDKGNERRFVTIEHQLGEINRKLDNLAGRG